MDKWSKNDKNKLIIFLLGLLAGLQISILVIRKIIIKFKNRKNIFRKVKFVKEYELDLPKNISRKETDELIKEIVATDEDVVAYAWKDKNSNEVYKLRKNKKD